MFRDREDAGRQLAERLKRRELRDPVLLGIPRGGVVVGAVLARELGAELDVVLSSKLRAPMQPELAIGAIAEGGEMHLNSYALESLEIDNDYLHRERQKQLEKIAARKALFRAVRPPAEVAGRSVIVTDDGIATGSTMIAALELLRLQEPLEVIVAVPVAPPDRLRRIRELCDEVVCLLTPDDFYGIGQFYDDFSHVEDAAAAQLLRQAYQEREQAAR